MKVLEQYYGPARSSPTRTAMCFPRGDYEAFLKVEIDGQSYAAQSRISDGSAQHGISFSVVMRNLQQQVLREIEKKLFG